MLSHPAISRVIQCIERKNGRKLREEFQELRKRDWGQHLRVRGYFVATTGQISSKDVQKYTEGQEAHHKHNNFKVSEF
ncbi:MAG: transposase [Alphaproteobacteria bacterium]|nr:transposase [Alphaproteobacteria bacterium]